MTQPDKLMSIGDKIAQKYTVLEPMEMAELAIEIDEVLADTMRENDRLREESKGLKGCLMSIVSLDAHDDIYFAQHVANQRLEECGIFKQHPCKHTNDDSPQTRRIKRKLEPSKTSGTE